MPYHTHEVKPFANSIRFTAQIWADEAFSQHNPSLTLIICRGYSQAENETIYRIAVREVLVSCGFRGCRTVIPGYAAQ